MTVDDLLVALEQRFPASDAEAWDHVGLSVGDPGSNITGICVALDATTDNVLAACECGANVLLTHHPVYIKAPASFRPACSLQPSSSSALFEAARRGVSIVSLHTNLDRSREARDRLPSLIGMVAESSLEYPHDPVRHGLGALAFTEDTTLREVSLACARAFRCEPRVWGALDRSVGRIAFLGGSLGDFGELAILSSADAIVCGEAGYHVCQDLCARGVGIILLGHDRSEEPFVDILKEACVSAGYDGGRISTIVRPRQWNTLRDEELA
ncbi:MAG: Nif3-like dinuclear metal center hexameric protein [Collinsella sp.]|nr:Nif3-like dinuclear metal center hexameric protein [Collinsella sp.]